MTEAGVDERFHLLEREIRLAGEAIDALSRDYRAAIDTLRLEVEVLRRCVMRLQPELAEQFDTMRAELIQHVDPEAP
jgi:hypothetical protein